MWVTAFFTEGLLFSQDKADCSVCTSAPFATLCLLIYHLLCPGWQAEGQGQVLLRAEVTERLYLLFERFFYSIRMKLLPPFRLRVSSYISKNRWFSFLTFLLLLCISAVKVELRSVTLHSEPEISLFLSLTLSHTL